MKTTDRLIILNQRVSRLELINNILKKYIKNGHEVFSKKELNDIRAENYNSIRNTRKEINAIKNPNYNDSKI